MTYTITTRRVAPQAIAAVQDRMHAADIPTGFGRSLDQVWAFVRSHPGLHQGGHNLFLYHHDMDGAGAMTIDFGVQVTRAFESEGAVRCVWTPEGEVAAAVHRGPYSGLGAAHAEIHAWAAANRRTFAGRSWEIYGDWHDDPAKLETEILYLLA